MFYLLLVLLVPVHGYDAFVNTLKNPLLCFNATLHTQNYTWITMMDKTYSVRFDDIVYQACSLSSAASFGVIALDDETHSYFDVKGVPVIKWFGARKCTLDAISCAKFEFMYELVSRGVSFVFTEADVFWMRDVVTLRQSTVDVQVSEHNYCPEINFGVFFMEASRGVVEMMRGIARFVKDSSIRHLHQKQGFAYDQKIFDYALRGCHDSGVWLCENGHDLVRQRLDEFKVYTGHVQYTRIPFAAIPHSSSAGFQVQSLSAAHVWYGSGEQRTRSACRSVLPQFRCPFNTT
jgi:hypothetical protein